MIYIKYTRELNSKGYHWPWKLVIEAWWTFQWTWLFTAEYTLFWIFWDDDLAKIDEKYSPEQYTAQEVVDEMNTITDSEYYSLAENWFYIINSRPED